MCIVSGSFNNITKREILDEVENKIFIMMEEYDENLDLFESRTCLLVTISTKFYS